MLGQDDARHDRALGLTLLVGDLVKARDVRIGLPLAAPDEMAVGAEPLSQVLAVHGVGLVRHGTGKCRSYRQ